MAEYIKRTDVMKICEEHIKRCFNSNDSYGQHAATKIFDDVVELPTADVVEVVRCKDCKHLLKDAMICSNENNMTSINKRVYYGHFCSYGERE